MEHMSERTCLISSLSLLLVQTQVARWKAANTEQLTSAHLYLDIAKSGYLFRGFSSGMVSLQYIPRNMQTVLLCFALLWLCNRS